MNEQNTPTERRADRLATPETRVSGVTGKHGAVKNSDPLRQSMAEVEHEPPTTGAHRSFVRGGMDTTERGAVEADE